MNRRQLLQSLAALGAASQLHADARRKFRLHPGLVAYSFRKALAAKTMTYESLIELVSDLGLDGLDTTVYWFPDTSDEYLAKLRRTAYKNGVSLYSIAVRNRLAQPTAELQAKEFESFKQWVDVAEKLGATHIRVFGGAIPKGATEEQAIGWAVEVMKRFAEYSGKRGIFVGVEDDGGLTTTAEPTLEIVKRTDSPWAGMNLDVGNFPKNGYAQVAMCIPYAVSTHFKEKIANENGVKEPVDMDRLIGMFAKGGYKGYLSLEYESDGAPETEVPRLAGELRRRVRAAEG